MMQIMVIGLLCLSQDTSALARRQVSFDSIVQSTPTSYEYWDSRDREMLRRPTRLSPEWAWIEEIDKTV